MNTLQWRCNERDGVSNHQLHDCLLNRMFRCRSKKASKPSDTVLCEGNSPVTDEFPAQRASNVENVSIWWRHHEFINVISISMITQSTRKWLTGKQQIQLIYKRETQCKRINCFQFAGESSMIFVNRWFFKNNCNHWWNIHLISHICFLLHM